MKLDSSFKMGALMYFMNNICSVYLIWRFQLYMTTPDKPAFLIIICEFNNRNQIFITQAQKQNMDRTSFLWEK